MAEKKGFIIALDGPAASGKGTIASRLSKYLGGFYLYSGAVYRSIALLCIERGIDLSNEKSVESILPDFNFGVYKNKIFLNETDVTERIKKPDTASGASVVGVYNQVRKKGASIQQEIARKAINDGLIVIAEGRDMGTTVFPDASLKIYLTARPEVRAKRRMEQYLSTGADLKKELAALAERDSRDSRRSVSPLPANPEDLGYFILDNSEMNEAETLDVIKKELKNKKLI